MNHQWEPHQAERAVYVCKTCGAIKRTSFSRFKKKAVETACRGDNPEPLPVVPAGPRRVILTPEVLIDMMIVVLFWRATEAGASGRSFTTMDHLRLVLERIGLLTIKQGGALYKDSRVQRLFKRKTVFAYTSTRAEADVWLAKKPLLAKIPSDDNFDIDSMKMLRNYRVYITDAGIKEARDHLQTKYVDTLFTREAVYAVEEALAVERKEFERKRAMGIIIDHYNAKVTAETSR